MTKVFRSSELRSIEEIVAPYKEQIEKLTSQVAGLRHALEDIYQISCSGSPELLKAADALSKTPSVSLAEIKKDETKSVGQALQIESQHLTLEDIRNIGSPENSVET